MISFFFAAALHTAEPPQYDLSDCGNAGGQIAINACFREKAAAAQVLMDAAWQKFSANMLLPGETVEPPILEEQSTAQSAFVMYRDMHCQTRASAMAGGSATDMVLYACMAELSEMRAQQLTDLIELF